MFEYSSRVLWNVQFFDHVMDATFYLHKSRLWFWILELNDVTWKRSLGYRSHKQKTRKQSLCIVGLRRIKSHMWYFVIHQSSELPAWSSSFAILSCSSTHVLPWDTTLWMDTENYFLIEGQSNLRRHLACVHPPLVSFHTIDVSCTLRRLLVRPGFRLFSCSFGCSLFCRLFVFRELKLSKV